MCSGLAATPRPGSQKLPQLPQHGSGVAASTLLGIGWAPVAGSATPKLLLHCKLQPLSCAQAAHRPGQACRSGHNRCRIGSPAGSWAHQSSQKAPAGRRAPTRAWLAGPEPCALQRLQQQRRPAWRPPPPAVCAQPWTAERPCPGAAAPAPGPAPPPPACTFRQAGHEWDHSGCSQLHTTGLPLEHCLAWELLKPAGCQKQLRPGVELPRRPSPGEKSGASREAHPGLGVSGSHG